MSRLQNTRPAYLLGESVLIRNFFRRLRVFVFVAGLLVFAPHVSVGVAQGAVPAAPGSLKATAISSTVISLSWVDKSNNENGFVLERKTDTSNFLPVLTIGANTTSVNDTVLNSDTSYAYRLSAYNWSGTSDYSNISATSTFPSPTPTPTATSVSSPSARFYYSPSSPLAGQTIQFTDASIDPSSQIIYWFWDFGDGVPSFLQNPTHMFNSGGNYSVSLSIVDRNSLFDMTTRTLIIGGPSATPSPTPVPTNTPALSAKRPCGIFSIDGVVSQPFVDGVLIRVFWNTIQPSINTFDWSSVDQQISNITSAGKKATLVVFPVPNTPSWVFSAGAQSYLDSDGNVKPIPWDTTFLYYWQALVDAMGSRYANNSSITQISATGPSGDVRLRTLPPGYTSTLFINAWTSTLDHYARAFPKTFMNVPISVVPDGTDPSATPSVIVNYAINQYNQTSKRFGAYGEMLTGLTPTGNLGTLFANTAATAWVSLQACGAFGNQAIWSGCNFAPGDTVNGGLQHGFDLGASYFELYSSDLTDPANASILQSWRNKICP